MRQSNSKYPISILLAVALNKSCADSLASLLGYKNKSKMLRRLNEWLLTGKGTPNILTKLLNTGILQEPQLSEALNKTSLIQKDEENALRQKHFRPHIYIETDHPVTSALMGLLASKVKYIYDQELTLITDETDQLKRATIICQDHFLKNLGKCEYFGGIISYKFYPELDKEWSILPNGEGFWD